MKTISKVIVGLVIALFAVFVPTTAQAADLGPFTVDQNGVTLPPGQTFQPGGHVNIQADPEGRDLHFEAKCVDRIDHECAGPRHEMAQFIGQSFIPWSVFHVGPGACVKWVQVSQFNYHFGENGEAPICVGQPPVEEPPVVPAFEYGTDITCTSFSFYHNEFYDKNGRAALSYSYEVSGDVTASANYDTVPAFFEFDAFPGAKTSLVVYAGFESHRAPIFERVFVLPLCDTPVVPPVEEPPVEEPPGTEEPPVVPEPPVEEPPVVTPEKPQKPVVAPEQESVVVQEKATEKVTQKAVQAPSQLAVTGEEGNRDILWIVAFGTLIVIGASVFGYGVYKKRKENENG